MSRAGRRPGNPDTQTEILEAAKAVFGEMGYDRATIREIAGRAGIDPALVHHYFGNKDKLYAASISLPVNPATVVGDVFATVAEEERGEALARMFLSLWEDPATRTALTGILRSAMSGEEQAVAAFREYISSVIKGTIAKLIPHEDAELRALSIAGQIVGLVIIRYVVEIEPVASASTDDLVKLIGPRIQSYLG